jgi:hypothetical protein
MTYYMRMNFEHYMSSDSFFVAGASPIAKKYSYANLPIIMGPFDFGQKPDILIADEDALLCFNGFELKAVEKCTECELSASSYEILPCIGDKIYIKLKFKSQNPGVKGFSIRGNGIVYQDNASYNDSIHYIGPIVPNCTQKYEFIIIDNANPNCKTEINLSEKLCCKSCEIGALTINEFCTITETGIKLNFNSSQIVNDSVAVLINNDTIGKYKKGTDPLKINYAFQNGKSYKITITSIWDPSCTKTQEFKFECKVEPCSFSAVSWELTDCTADGKFKMTLKFTPIGAHGEKFYAKVNDQVFGPFTYGAASYSLGPLDEICKVLRLELKDAKYEDCIFVVEKELKKCCEVNEPCEINLKSIEAICFEDVIIGLKIIVPGKEGSGYKLLVDGVEVAVLKYSNSPLLVNIMARPEGKMKIKIIDIANPDCFQQLEPSLNCENCSINDITAKAVDCKDDSVKFSIGFDVTNTFSDSVIIFINGIKIGRFGNNQSPIMTPFFAKGQTFTVKIFDYRKELCNGILEIKDFDCKSSTANYGVNAIKIYSQNSTIVFENLEPNEQYTITLHTIDGRIIKQEKINTNSNKFVINSPLSGQLNIAKIESPRGVFAKLIFLN